MLSVDYCLFDKDSKKGARNMKFTSIFFTTIESISMVWR